MGWEDHEVANLLILIGQELDFKPARLIKTLEQTSSGSPGIIAILIDNGYEFTPRQLINLFMNQAQNIHKYFSYISAALECQLFNFSDPDTLTAVCLKVCVAVFHQIAFFSFSWSM